jgi:hypothetical protein
MSSSPVRVTLAIITALERHGIQYHLGGSFASSVHGVPRHTRDADLVADIALRDVSSFVADLRTEYYVDAEMIRDAIHRRASFNLIHLASGFKVDIFVLGSTPFDVSEFERRIRVQFDEETRREVFVKSPEDTVLHKLLWYREGGEVSERQWTDVIGILKTQGDRLDLYYLRQWADQIQVRDLLDGALDACGIKH